MKPQTTCCFLQNQKNLIYSQKANNYHHPLKTTNACQAKMKFCNILRNPVPSPEMHLVHVYMQIDICAWICIDLHRSMHRSRQITQNNSALTKHTLTQHLHPSEMQRLSISKFNEQEQGVQPPKQKRISAVPCNRQLDLILLRTNNFVADKSVSSF